MVSFTLGKSRHSAALAGDARLSPDARREPALSGLGKGDIMRETRRSSPAPPLPPPSPSPSKRTSTPADKEGAVSLYMGTSLIRNTPSVGPCSSPMPRELG